MKMPRLIILALLASLSFSCEKKYTCVCTTVSNESIVKDAVKTTRLGSKGYKKTCENFPLADSLIRHCHLE